MQDPTPREKEPPKKVQLIAPSYYQRKDIQRVMFEFCKHRETVANFNNKFFAKRPDALDYPTDISNAAKQGATSFHCSEEIWENPLDINTDMTPDQYNEIKIGWDLLIDIDSPFLDYGKIAARLLINEFERHGIKNYGIKFSGSKGFHILIPFKAFPKEVQGEQTKDNFPEWPRLIAGYLFERIREPMNNEILGLTDRDKLKESGELISENFCPKCGQPTIKRKNYKYKCPDIRCKSELEGFTKKRVAMLCPSCNAKMDIVNEREIDFCETCKISTAKIEASTSNYGGSIREVKIEFKKEDTIKSTEDSVDIVLVSPRHLFRAPYSLHEKTAFSSIVITKDQIENFRPSDADPLKIGEPKSFMPESEEGEARELLLQALDWGRINKPEKTKKYDGAAIDLQGLTITEEMYPPVIKKILKGIKDDGRKRALSLVLSFFTSLEMPEDFIDEKIREWNKKNYHPLKEGYIRSQIMWHIKNKRMPPNYDKPVYKEFGIRQPPEPGIKNPINYTIRIAFRVKNRGTRPNPKKNNANNQDKKKGPEI
ncbi:hypothetical protein HOA55_00875 [archaeon]|jgi:hypothetical protein|nr:hypothetical protein [archaeon]MBT3577646.1 hypothetical protein [archaeon]MBT6819888.1 hypothetical protein [archaeon]